MSLPNLTTREIECGHPGIFPFPVDVKSKSSQMLSKLCRNLRAHEHDEHSCRCHIHKSAEIHDTCIRPRECVCGSTISTASACSTAVSSSSQKVGASSPIPSCLGIGGHPSGSRQGHPRYTGARSAGRPWVAHEIGQHSTQCRNTPNIFLFFFLNIFRFFFIFFTCFFFLSFCHFLYFLFIVSLKGN